MPGREAGSYISPRVKCEKAKENNCYLVATLCHVPSPSLWPGLLLFIFQLRRSPSRTSICWAINSTTGLTCSVPRPCQPSQQPVHPMKPLPIPRSIWITYLGTPSAPLSSVRCYFSPHNCVMSTDGTSHEVERERFSALIWYYRAESTW